MTGRKFKSYLDRLREHLEVLDDALEDAVKRSGAEKKDDRGRLQWMKMIRDLVELRNATLQEIKAHLLGRDETGAITEPSDHYHGNPEVMFERDFQTFLKPWHESDLNLECEDCGVENEEVETRQLAHTTKNEFGFEDTKYEDADLCEKCYDKRVTESSGESTDAEDIPEPASKGDIRAILQTAALQIKALETLPIEQRIAKLEELLANKPEVAPGMEPAYQAYRGVLQKALDASRASHPNPTSQS